MKKVVHLGKCRGSKLRPSTSKRCTPHSQERLYLCMILLTARMKCSRRCRQRWARVQMHHNFLGEENPRQPMPQGQNTKRRKQVYTPVLKKVYEKSGAPGQVPGLKTPSKHVEAVHSALPGKAAFMHDSPDGKDEVQSPMAVLCRSRHAAQEWVRVSESE